MNATPRPINSLLHAADAELGTILRHANYLGTIRGVVVDVLPESAAAHVHVAAVDDGHLLLHTDSAGWATRLRYAEESIRRALAQRLRLHTETVTTRVRPALAQAARPRVERRLGTANREHMKGVARYVDDPELAQALLRLARLE